MAPGKNPKATTKVQRTIVKATRPKASPVTIIKAISCKNNTEKVLKVNNAPMKSRPRTSTVPKMPSPKPKEQKSISSPGNVSKSAKKLKANWKRTPKPAHSGVPVPENMKKLIGKQLIDLDSSF